jgi:hypothetical protein
MQALVATGSVAFLSVTLAILIQNIYPPTDKLTLQKDAAALASLERLSPMDAVYAEARSLPSPATGNTEIDLANTPPKERSQLQVAKATLVASRPGSLDRKRNIHSDGPRRSSTLKNLRNLQTQRPAPIPQRHELRGLSSFFVGIGHALGFSRN